jgi:hypothetical protein
LAARKPLIRNIDCDPPEARVASSPLAEMIQHGHAKMRFNQGATVFLDNPQEWYIMPAG